MPAHINTARRVYDPVFLFSEFERNIRMYSLSKHYQAPESAQQLKDRLTTFGLKCYCVARRWYVIWIPWECKAINICNARRIKKMLGLPDGKFTGDFIYYCMLDREPLDVSGPTAQKYPMPLPAAGHKHAETRAMTKWAQAILT
jgi:hypothetical protein